MSNMVFRGASDVACLDGHEAANVLVRYELRLGGNIGDVEGKFDAVVCVEVMVSV